MTATPERPAPMKADARVRGARTACRRR